jgi:hypothetical protein
MTLLLAKNLICRGVFRGGGQYMEDASAVTPLLGRGGTDAKLTALDLSENHLGGLAAKALMKALGSKSAGGGLKRLSLKGAKMLVTQKTTLGEQCEGIGCSLILN